MAQPTDGGSYRQFSVIVRLRQGTECSLSTLGIILEIQNHLKPYKCICNVALSSPNFIIHLPTLELQLQILSCKSFKGPDYVLDIVPWCSEYISLDLPWISTSLDQGNAVSIQPHRETAYNPNIPSSSDTRNLAAQLSSQYNSSSEEDFLCKNTVLIIEAVHLGGDADTLIDFSYLMLAEMKHFYSSKFKAFQTCKQTCKEIYGIAQVFSNQIQQAIESVQAQARIYNSAPPQDILHQIATFGADLNNLLWFISEEIFDLQIAMERDFAKSKQPIDLSKFFDHHRNEEFMVPVAAMPVLKNIAESTVLQIYGKRLLIATNEDYDETFSTQIWCTSFHHEYKATRPMTQQQAETTSIYRFLKHITNVLGYTIADENSNILRAVVGEIISLGGTVSELQLQINKITRLVHHVQENIKKLHSCIPSDVWQTETSHVSNKISDLFGLLQNYTHAVDHGSQTFENHRQLFRSIKFQSMYPCKADGT